MQISGEYTLYAPRERVWEALLDPDMLRRIVPGCERLEREDADRYRVRANVHVAAVQGIYDGRLRLSDVQRPEHYSIAVEGSGARGVLHGEGAVRLEARDPGTTVIHYSGQAQLGGTIASVGSRMAQGAAELLLKQYFARLADTLEVEQRQPVSAAAGSGTVTRPNTDARHAISNDGSTAAALLVGELPRRGPLMRFVRRSGLSDGSIEGERHVARLLAGSTAGLIVLAAVGVALSLGLSGRLSFARR
jgi:uncharacterized protein